VTVVAAPSITGFSASPASITSGSSSTLSASFAGGTGIVSPGSLTIASGGSVAVSPAATTTYTLTVTNAAGSATTTSTAVTVTSSGTTSASLGANLGWVNDWDPTQPFADAMKQARKFGSTSSPSDESATVDANGWPAQDAGVLITANNQGSWTLGSYALSFTGQATVKAAYDTNVSVGAVTYNSSSNTSTATVTVGSGYKYIALVFTGTKRTASSSSGSGVTNIALLRPSLSGTPHAAGTLFTDRFLAQLKYFAAIRAKDYLNTDSSTWASWTDRSIPAYASQQQVPAHKSRNQQSSYVDGGSYEYAIQLANLTGKDIYLTVPHLAFGGTYAFSSTTWATNLALLCKYGSDVTGAPYTGVYGSTGSNPQPQAGPVNPALATGLHVYLEYSNEFWSGVGSQTSWIQTQASAAITAKDSDLDWDNSTSQFTVEMRIAAKGTMLIAQAFQSVYGTSAFGSIYRPLLCAQFGNTGTYVGMTYLNQRHGPASQYVWAIAGAPYIDYSGDSSGNTLSAAQVVAGMQAYLASYVVNEVSALNTIATTYGLAGGFIAYEGGQGAVYQTSGAVAAQTLPAMRTVVTTLLDDWLTGGGGIFFYFKLCSADTWGLSTDVSYDIDADTGYNASPSTSSEAQPKWGAIKQIATLGQ